MLAAWDTLSVPNWRQKLFAPYQGGRVFERDIVEQLDRLPELVAACGFANAKARRLRGRRFPRRRGRRARRRAAAASIVASGDRDAFQLASDRTTIVHPLRAGEVARIGPAEVRERYGVEPRAGARFHRAPRRPVRQDPRRARHGTEGRGDAAQPIPDARGCARRRALRRPGGGPPPLPPHRDDGRRRADPAAPRHDADLGERRRRSPATGASRRSPTGWPRSAEALTPRPERGTGPYRPSAATARRRRSWT